LLKCLGELARPLLFSLRLADALILDGALLAVRHQGRGRWLAMNIVGYIGIETGAARADKNESDHESLAARRRPHRSRMIVLGLFPPTHGTIPRMLDWRV